MSNCSAPVFTAADVFFTGMLDEEEDWLKRTCDGGGDVVDVRAPDLTGGGGDVVDVRAPDVTGGDCGRTGIRDWEPDLVSSAVRDCCCCWCWP